MHLVPVILDSAFPSAGNETTATLTLPLATGSVLDYLVLALSRLDHGPILVVTDAIGENGCSRFAWPQTMSQVRRTSFAELRQHLATLEASDYLLVVEARYWPVDGYDLVCIADAGCRYKGATHFIAVGNQTSGPKERVECDGQGRIRRVQRLYDAVTWSGSTTDAPLCSIVPARAVPDAGFRSLAQLREQLLDSGVFTQDLPYPSNAWDLTRAADVLALSEQTICQTRVCPDDPGFHVHCPGVLAWETCTISPSVRFIPPVVLHPHARIEDGATLVGPVVVGCRAVVGEKAVIARSVLAPGASVGAGARVRQRLILRQASHTAGSADTTLLSEGLPPSLAAPGIPASLGTWEPPTRGRKGRTGRSIKRLLDVVLALLGLLVFSPLLLVVSALVKLTSPGPVFFIHRREGRNGREFGCLKFRTMVVNAHAMQRDLYEENQVDGPQFKMANDPRVTRVGRFLRATNIDELPQLINVLLGHMSLVGPRPSPFRENQICVPWRLARLSVRPGITGLWQICRDRRSDGDFHQWIYYDIAYVRHLSLWVDLKILFQTIVTGGGRKRVPLSRLIPAMTEPRQEV